MQLAAVGPSQALHVASQAYVAQSAPVGPVHVWQAASHGAQPAPVSNWPDAHAYATHTREGRAARAVWGAHEDAQMPPTPLVTTNAGLAHAVHAYDVVHAAHPDNRPLHASQKKKSFTAYPAWHEPTHLPSSKNCAAHDVQLAAVGPLQVAHEESHRVHTLSRL